MNHHADVSTQEEGCGNEEEYEASGEDAAQDDYREESSEQ